VSGILTAVADPGVASPTGVQQFFALENTARSHLFIKMHKKHLVTELAGAAYSTLEIPSWI